MFSEVTNLIFLFGSLQALLLIVGINLKGPLVGHKKKATTAVLLISFVVMIYYVAIMSGWEVLSSKIAMWGSISWMALLPGFYLFAQALTSNRFVFRKSQIAYFSLPLLFFCNTLLYMFFEFNLFAWTSSWAPFLDVWMFLFFASGAFFIFKTYRYLRTNAGHALSNSLMLVTKAFISVLSIYALVFCLIRQNYEVLFELSLVCILVVLIFGMVIRAFRFSPLPSFFGEPKYQNVVVNKNNDFVAVDKSVRSRLNEQELFRDPDLSLAKLADETGVTQNHLSQFFSVGLNSSFYEFINEHRLAHVEKLIRNGQFKNLTITGLAYESGFKSKSTFYKVFKEKHGMTPTEFIKRQKSPLKI